MRLAETGSLTPARQGRPSGGGKLAVHHDLLIRWVEADGDVTMPELAARLVKERQVVAHPASLSRYLGKAGYTVKNAAGERGRTRGRSAGVADGPSAPDAPWPHRLVFVDGEATSN